ncbi:hypothetical protein [Lederbergia citrisecunda]|uniref:hypothetical protein n=1 Tax=Lederbergia citrisecunda TaxID=2833583 RepID=UPI001F294B86|nr:hypothetical protein [Lederbergia citrisecunda]
MVMCQSFAPKFSVDAKILLERIAKQISGESSLVIINQIRETLSENDIMLIELEKKAQEFFGKEAFDHINFTIIQDMSMY